MIYENQNRTWNFFIRSPSFVINILLIFCISGHVIFTQAHWLYSSQCEVLQRFNDDWFIIFTPQNLGEIKYIHIWHDNYGHDPNWYCTHVEVIDVRQNKKWIFNVERWFSLMHSIHNIEHKIFPVMNVENWQIKQDDIQLTIRDEYIWASVFLR